MVENALSPILPVDLSDLLSGRQRVLKGSLSIDVPQTLAEEHGINESFRIKGSYQLTKDATKLILKLKFEAELTLTCDRCLEPYKYQVKDEVKEIFLDSLEFTNRYETYRGGTRTLNQEDLITFEYTGDTLDVGRIAFEEVVLRIPSKKLCSPNCKGLCPVCGANRNQVDCGHDKFKVQIFGLIDEEELKKIERSLRSSVERGLKR